MAEASTPPQKTLQLSKDEEDIVLLLAAFPRSAAKDLMGKLQAPISQPTLSRRIEALEKRGIIRREGKARTTVYSLADPRSYVSLPLQRRNPAAYDFEWIAGYDPDKTRFFSVEEENRLLAAGREPGVAPNLFFERVFERFLIDLSYASSKMEGNTYSLLDTERLIKQGELAQGKELEEATMILNHKRAVMHLVEHVQEIGVTERDIKDLHALLSKDLVQDGEPGKIRTSLVNITNSQYSPLAVPQQIDEQFKLLVAKAQKIESPFEQAFFLLAAISYLQPFIDVNKRTARLAANIPFFKAGLCPLSYRYMDTDRYMGGLLLFYETRNYDGLKDAFMDGYERSATALKVYYEEHRRQPERIDIAYRKGIDMAVREVVRGTDDPEKIIARVVDRIPAEDRPEVIKRVRSKVKALTPDNAIAYELFPDEVEAFQRGKKRQ